jgi:hypothetical protein
MALDRVRQGWIRQRLPSPEGTGRIREMRSRRRVAAEDCRLTLPTISRLAILRGERPKRIWNSPSRQISAPRSKLVCGTHFLWPHTPYGLTEADIEIIHAKPWHYLNLVNLVCYPSYDRRCYPSVFLYSPLHGRANERTMVGTCEAASNERDPSKLLEMTEEINRLLEEKEERLKRPHPPPLKFRRMRSIDLRSNPVRVIVKRDSQKTYNEIASTPISQH